MGAPGDLFTSDQPGGANVLNYAVGPSHATLPPGVDASRVDWP